ncbi:transcription termination factor NusB [Bradyrhizobium sp. GM2.4]
MADNNKKPPAGTEKKANRRGAARLAAVQALYQMDIGGAGINDIFAEFESHWLGNEVEGDTYLPARKRRSSATSSPASCATRRNSIR